MSTALDENFPIYMVVMAEITAMKAVDRANQLNHRSLFVSNISPTCSVPAFTGARACAQSPYPSYTRGTRLLMVQKIS